MRRRRASWLYHSIVLAHAWCFACAGRDASLGAHSAFLHDLAPFRELALEECAELLRCTDNQLEALILQLAHDVGIKLRQRVTDAGYKGAVGENLAGGQQTLEGAIDGWLNSPGHRSTLLSDKFVEFGVAVARVPAERKSRYGIYWCFIAGGPFEAWRVNIRL